MLATIYTKTLRDRVIGVLVGASSIALFLWMALAVYAEIDVSFYYDMPDAFLRAAGVSAELGGLAGVAFGSLFGFVGALTIGGLGISIGAGGIAGEERDGTLGLLLANPRSRRQVLASKLGALVTLLAVGGLVVWGGAVLVPVLLGVDVGETATGALSLHLTANALVWGSLAACLGAWTGRRTVASGVAAVAMVLSWLLVSFLPLMGEVWADVARAVPWYWFDGHGPEATGVDAGYLALQLGLSTALAGVAFVGVQRRDLRGGERGGAIVERLRAHPLTRRVTERLAGTVRTSGIAAKATTDHQGLLIGASAVLLYVGLIVVPLYTLLPDTVSEAFSQFPDGLLAAIGGVDMSTATGWIQGEHFSFTVPVAVVTVLVGVGAGALAGEEEDRTMDLLLSAPVPRWRVVAAKAVAMVALAAVLAVVTFAGVAGGVVLGGLEVSIANVAATSVLGALFGLVVGGVALLVSAASGRRRLAVGVAAGVGLLSYVAASFLPLADRFAPYAELSPFHRYLGSDPLTTGMPWNDAGLLVAGFLVLVALSVPSFARRDVHG